MLRVKTRGAVLVSFEESDRNPVALYFAMRLRIPPTPALRDCTCGYLLTHGTPEQGLHPARAHDVAYLRCRLSGDRCSRTQTRHSCTLRPRNHIRSLHGQHEGGSMREVLGQHQPYPRCKFRHLGRLDGLRAVGS